MDTAYIQNGIDSTLLSRIKSSWAEYEIPDAAAILARHPQLKRQKSVVLDLAYEEYCRRVERGEDVDTADFLRKFPSCQKSLSRLLEVHQFIVDEEPLPTEAGVPWPSPGDLFLGFKIVRELGRGGFARVFAAYEVVLGNRPVVVKVSREAAFEAEALGRLKHPNIVPVHSAQLGPNGQFSVLCMPYLGCVTLCDLLDQIAAEGLPKRARALVRASWNPDFERTPLEVSHIPRRWAYVDGIIDLGVQLADALIHSHAQGICHGDLKPSNVLLTPGGKPMLLDFNLCSFGLKVAGAGGTPPYMPPEHVQNILGLDAEGSCADVRSDLFSLGAVLYELLTGSLPFKADGSCPSSREHLKSLLELQKRGPLPLRSRNRCIDPRLAGIIEGCLAFDIERRPRSAEQLRNELRKCLSPFNRSTRLAVARPYAVTLAATLAISLISGAGYGWYHRDAYSVRQLQSAATYYAQGDCQAARASLNESLASDPKLRDALFLRGRVELQLGDPALAYYDFDSANKLAPDPRLTACMGYCLSRMQEPAAAIACYERAILEGFSSAELYNNLAFGCQQQGQTQKALKNYNRAILLSDRLQVAFANRAGLMLNEALQADRVPTEAIGDIERAVQLDPTSQELAFQAGCIYAAATRHEKSWSDKAVLYLKQAVSLGIEWQRIEQDPMLSKLLTEPAVLSVKPVAQPSNRVSFSRIVDPLPGALISLAR